MKIHDTLLSLSLHSFLLVQFTVQEDLGFSGKSEQQLDEEREECICIGVCASRHIPEVLFVGEISADWVWLWVCPKWDEGSTTQSC